MPTDRTSKTRNPPLSGWLVSQFNFQRVSQFRERNMRFSTFFLLQVAAATASVAGTSTHGSEGRSRSLANAGSNCEPKRCDRLEKRHKSCRRSCRRLDSIKKKRRCSQRCNRIEQRIVECLEECNTGSGGNGKRVDYNTCLEEDGPPADLLDVARKQASCALRAAFPESQCIPSAISGMSVGPVDENQDDYETDVFSCWWSGIDYMNCEVASSDRDAVVRFEQSNTITGVKCEDTLFDNPNKDLSVTINSDLPNWKITADIDLDGRICSVSTDDTVCSNCVVCTYTTSAGGIEMPGIQATCPSGNSAFANNNCVGITQLAGGDAI